MPSSLLRTIVHCILDRQRRPVYPYYQCFMGNVMHYYVRVNKTLASMLLCVTTEIGQEKVS